MNLTAPLVSVAVLHQEVSIHTLEQLIAQLADEFMYFEVLVINPKFAPPPNWT